MSTIIVVCLATVAPAQVSPPRADKAARVVFAVYEGPRINVYAWRLGEAGPGAGELLISEEAGQHLSPTIRVRISPRGNLIAYKGLRPPTANGAMDNRLFVIDRRGQNRTLVAERVEDFFWAPDGDRILYSRRGPTPPSEERPLRPLGWEWRLLDVATREEEVIAREDDYYVSLEAWQGRHLIFDDHVGLVPYELDKRPRATDADPRSIQTVKAVYGIRRLSPSPSGRRALLVAEGSDHTTTLYDVNSEWRVERTRPVPHCTLSIPLWNNNEEVFYQKVPSPWDATLPEHCRRRPICRYSLATQTERVVLDESGPDGIYALQGLLPGHALLISSVSPGPVPQYTLQTRHLDGSRRDTLYTSDRRITFVGWLP